MQVHRSSQGSSRAASRRASIRVMTEDDRLPIFRSMRPSWMVAKFTQETTESLPILLHHLVDERIRLARIEVILPDQGFHLLELLGPHQDVTLVRCVHEIEGRAATRFDG